MNDHDRTATCAEEGALTGRVLIVEADAAQASRIVTVLTSLGEGWTSVRVPTAQECLHLLDWTTFSVALIDFILPDQNGLELIREIRRRGYVLAAILMTAHGNEATAIEALRLGVADYIKKDEGFFRYLPAAVARVVACHRQQLMKVSTHSRLRLQLSQRAHRGLLDSFAAPIVHDIKSPLACIAMVTSAMAPAGDAPAMPVPDAVPIIRRSVDRIERLVDRLLKFARQEVEDRTSVDLAQVLPTLADAETESLKLQNIRVVRDICPGPVMVRVAAKALDQVFLNLLANAAEALVVASGGGVVTIGLSQDRGSAVATVSDNGPGIPADALPNLFKSFSSFGKAKGTGLGLSISAGIVREHGGHMQAENLPSGGARFTVVLPLEAQGPVALVLEDEPHVRDLIAAQLEFLGVRADMFDDGSVLLPVLATGKWDLVILDVRTPDINGIEVFKQIVARRPELVARTMVVSGSIADEDLQTLLADHPIPCLPKPYSQDQFNDMVRLLLRNE
ncbi:MAG: response regulator [Candidatus Riflebacteria bacterium]|nr:response regulator [Candidatus Riflebacteria bacterium]